MRKHMSGVAVLCLALFAAAVSAGAQSELNEEQIYKAQSKLYEANILTQLPDGKMGSRTEAAVRAWQARTKQPQTGALTKEGFQRLMRFDPGKHAWEAIAGSPDGSWAAVWGYESGVKAATAALAGCRKRSSRPDECMYISNSVDKGGPGWSAAVFCKQRGLFRRKSQMFLHNGLTRQSAVDQAFAMGKTAGFSRPDCSLVKALDGNGAQ